MTRSEAFRRLRSTITPEHVVCYVKHADTCPTFASSGFVPAPYCRCGGIGYAYSVVPGATQGVSR